MDGYSKSTLLRSVDTYSKSFLLDILDTYRDLASDQAGIEGLAGILEEMWNECLRRAAFGYSDHQLAIVPELPNLFRMVKPLIRSKEELQRFCRAMPAIAKWLPYYSDEGPVGYSHTILTGTFGSRAQACRTLEEFLRGFEGHPIAVCDDCGKDMTVERREADDDAGYVRYTVRCVCGSCRFTS